MHTSFLADPLWTRLGFDAPPDETQAGEGVGIVITDTAINHPLIQHLAGRLKKVTVNEDMSVICHDIVLEEPEESAPYPSHAEHGMLPLLFLSHLPFELEGKKYVGLVPKATFIMLDCHEPDLMKKGMEWIIERRKKWNVKIVINFMVCGSEFGIRQTSKDPIAQALILAVEAGMLVVTANGNSPALINNSPIDFFAAGGYDDRGLKDSSKKPHPMPSWGKNGDGHVRPDILAPFTYLPAPYYDCIDGCSYSPYSNPFNKEKLISYFGGTCGTSAIIGGICAYILSMYPDLDVDTLRRVLVQNGTLLENSPHPAPVVDVGKTLKAIEKAETIQPLPSYPKPISIGDANLEIHSENELKRGIALTTFIEEEKISRAELWNYVEDPSPLVQKVAILFGLKKTMNSKERELAWRYFYDSEFAGLGVREAWAYMLAFGAEKEELSRWMKLVTDSSADVRCCVRNFLKQYYPDAPDMEHTPDTNSDVIRRITLPVREWYRDLATKEYI